MGINDFLLKLSENEDFAAKYSVLDGIDTVLEQAAKDGYVITENDVQALRFEAEYHISGRVEMSDEMLDAVAGGTLVGMEMVSNKLWTWVKSLFGGKPKIEAEASDTLFSGWTLNPAPAGATAGAAASNLLFTPADSKAATTLLYTESDQAASKPVLC